ncbi:MAG TPA: hypothetical protein VJU84_11330 [Pyrinomonadaceae bacterium]|nr:hypothetical protein [Pyrinomonadaceae bacterium]
MADITYGRTFQHEDWIDNEDVVQAGGEKGFNKKFHDIEAEFDRIGTVVGSVNTEINRIQRLQFLSAEAGVTINPASATAEFPVEIYDRATLPTNVEKAYFVVIFPVSGPTNVQHTLLYRTNPGNKIAVTVQFFNPGAVIARLNFRVLTLATQA